MTTIPIERSRFSGMLPWGWNAHWEQLSSGLAPPVVPARVVQHRHHHYELVLAPDARTASAQVSGSYAFGAAGPADFPTAGDWVLVNTESLRIQRLLERRTAIRRAAAGNETLEQVIVANIDVVLLVFGLDGGRNFTVGLLERSLAVAWNSGAQPIVVLNKLDLAAAPHVAQVLADVQQSAVGVAVHTVSAVDGEGIERLAQEFAPGQTVGMLGKSGVGKSALLNAIGRHYHADTQAKVGAQRSGDLQGRHTTTHKELALLPAGPVIADVPGLRELQLWGEVDDLGASFPEIEALAAECRFRDCSHGSEPGCRVQQALAQGELSTERYARYLEMQKELAYLERRKDARLVADERKKWRQIAKDHRRAKGR